MLGSIQDAILLACCMTYVNLSTCWRTQCIPRREYVRWVWIWDEVWGGWMCTIFSLVNSVQKNFFCTKHRKANQGNLAVTSDCNLFSSHTNTQIYKWLFSSLWMFFTFNTVLCVFVLSKKCFFGEYTNHKYILQNDQNFICAFVNFYLSHK
jgi:hypothetical protein